MTISTLRLSMRPSSFCSLNRARSIAQYGVLLPLSRKHELEADQIGLTYMARAGYDLRESVAFWKRMMAASQGGKPPEFMSTHPADQTRISQLEQLMPAALEIYQKAVQQ
jgi:predicted Zn-dependent protease